MTKKDKKNIECLKRKIEDAIMKSLKKNGNIADCKRLSKDMFEFVSVNFPAPKISVNTASIKKDGTLCIDIDLVIPHKQIKKGK